MTRVLSVVNRSIMVYVEDVLPGDVLWVSGNENDPIIAEILTDVNRRQLVYKPGAGALVPTRVWMDKRDKIFIHDLHRERFDL